MNKYKRYSIFLVFLLLILAIFHNLVWYNITGKVIIDNISYKGDLARNIYKLDSIYLRPSYIPDYKVNLEQQHERLNKWEKGDIVDLVTIGDSFSNADTQGLNPFYQDYIASYNQIKVLNIPRHINYSNNFFETILSMINNSVIDDIKPKYILIQSVERFAIERFSKKFNFEFSISKSEILKGFNQKQLKLDGTLLNNKNIFNNKNFKALKNNIKFLINKNGKYGGVYITQLNNNFFTSSDKNSLLFFHEDIKNIEKTNINTVNSLNKNFNILARLLKKKNIKLYFMPAVDKYNLYSKYIINNHYPKSQFFELLRKLPKEYEFIDTKKILREELEKGVTDLYYSDDTHWSYKASEAIFSKVKFE